MSEADTRARNAAAILDNPVFNEAIEELKARAVKSWLDCKDPEERERLWMWTNQAIRLREHFVGIVDNAKIDAARVARGPIP
jgi:hypothetical protein